MHQKSSNIQKLKTKQCANSLVLVSLVICTAACSPTSSSSDTADDELVLTELREISKEVKNLRTEIAVIREAVTDIHRVSVATPNAPPVVQNIQQIILDPDDPQLGNRDAKIAIVEFTDYECPFCLRYHEQTFPKIKETYVDTGQVQYSVRDFPLDFHANARAAAIAANCSGEQGAYWEMRDSLFSQQRQLGTELYNEIAQNLELDSSTFSACISNQAQVVEINGDLNYGQNVGISGTPSFYIGRVEKGMLVDAQRLVGAQPLAAFERAIEAMR